MDSFIEEHLERVRLATFDRLGRKDLPRWIEQKTFINGKPFSFKGHEYQERILLEESTQIAIRKSAQTGISEMAMRMALGLIMLMPGAFRIGYTLPSATFASDYAKTRLNSIINGSPTLRAAVSSEDIDAAALKTFGYGKELYFKGAAVGNAAISTSLDMLIHDELSFSDQDVIGDYSSRTIHSDYKWKTVLSTPTFPGDPIDVAFQNSKRWWNLCKCDKCGHRFVPDYYKNVAIPGWTKELEEINKRNLHLVNHLDAVFLCPACKRPASLRPEYREWVCENPTENHRTAGFQVQPFDAPSVVTLSDLIIGSTSYSSKSKFMQFALGRPAEDAESGMTLEEVESIGVNLVGSAFSSHVMGIDLGVVSHFMIGGVAANGQLVVVHYERVPLAKFRERYFALKLQYRISVAVSDIQPFTDLVMSLSKDDQNLYGARYVTRQGLEIYDVKVQDPDRESALEGVKEVSVNRNALFDRLLTELRPPEEGGETGIVLRRLDDWELVKKHLTDMKRASATLRNGEFTSVWQKSTGGEDHYHHSLGYLWIAAQMRGIAHYNGSGGMPALHKFKVTDPAARRR